MFYKTSVFLQPYFFTQLNIFLLMQTTHVIVLVLLFATTVLCFDPIPGIDKLGVGFDIVHGELRNHVIEFSYQANKTWQNPNYPTMIYAVPDQADVFNFPGSSVTNEQFDAVSTQQYSRSLTENAGISFSYGMKIIL